nr:MAG TPA: hypothetical protein [Bacteriophage sp.]
MCYIFLFPYFLFIYNLYFYIYKFRSFTNIN